MIFVYMCTDCLKKNKTDNPPEDNVMHCIHCGRLTVQAFSAVEPANLSTSGKGRKP